LRIVIHHLLPNAAPPLIVQTSIAMAVAILLEASLSFLGLGVQPPQPSWGAMLSDSRQYLRLAPWYGIAPGAALTVLLVALTLCSDALRDILDPRRSTSGKSP
jgi:peptide/nickel transport system permease protein